LWPLCRLWGCSHFRTGHSLSRYWVQQPKFTSGPTYSCSTHSDLHLLWESPTFQPSLPVSGQSFCLHMKSRAVTYWQFGSFFTAQCSFLCHMCSYSYFFLLCSSALRILHHYLWTFPPWLCLA
jgi:hypothetical protein